MRGLYHSTVIQKTTRILAGMDIPVYTEGFKPRVEYSTATGKPVAVYLPEIPDDASKELIEAMQGYIDHECGHILESNSADICNTSKSKLWHYIHNCIEDPRINAKMADRYHGSEHNIRAGYEYMFARVDPETGERAYSKHHVNKINLRDKDALVDAQLRYSSMWFAAKSNCRFHGHKYEELDLAKVYRDLEAKMDASKVADLANITTAEQVFEASNYFEQFFYKEFNEEKGKGEAGETGDLSEEMMEKLKRPEDALGEALGESIKEAHLKKGKLFHFTNRFDEILSRDDIVGWNTTPIQQFEDDASMVTNYLAKDLRRMLEARDRVYHVGGYRSGKLNQKALASVKAGNDRIFTRKNEIRKVKAAVGLLIDLSGSMSGDRVELACKSAYAFSMVLTQLKVPHEVWGFSTLYPNAAKKAAYEQFVKDSGIHAASRVINTSSPDQLIAFKRFDETFNVQSKMALVKAANNGVGMRENEDSLHVKSALQRLGLRPEDNKTLFVLSDGCPAFAEPVANSKSMLRYLDEVALSHYGVQMYGIGIQHNAVKEYYSNSANVNKLSDLPKVLFEFLKTRI